MAAKSGPAGAARAAPALTVRHTARAKIASAIRWVRPIIENICFMGISLFVMAPAESLTYAVFESGEQKRRAVHAPQHLSYLRRSCSDRRPDRTRRAPLAQHPERQRRTGDAPTERDYAADQQSRA